MMLPKNVLISTDTEVHHLFVQNFIQFDNKWALPRRFRVSSTVSHQYYTPSHKWWVLVIRFKKPKQTHWQFQTERRLWSRLFRQIQLSTVISNLEKRDLTRSLIAIDSGRIEFILDSEGPNARIYDKFIAISYANSLLFCSQLFRFNKQ